MGLINIPDETDLTTADANDLNSRFAIVTGLVNGNIDNANIKTGGVATSNLAGQSVTTSKIADAAITPQKITNPYKFSVYSNAAQPLPASTNLKVAFNTELFDSNNDFDTTANRYNVTVSGFYQINIQVGVATAGMSTTATSNIYLFKNGLEILRSGALVGSGNNFTLPRYTINDLIQLSSGDYLEVFAVCSESRTIDGGNNITHMSGFMVSQT